MHPLIADFPSARFYEGLLLSGISAQDRPLPKGVAFIIPSLCSLLATWAQAFGAYSQCAQEKSSCRFPLHSSISDVRDGGLGASADASH